MGVDKKMQKSVAMVMPGGGMRCAYSAGATVALAREFGLCEPGMILASSGSVGTMFYFLARQYDAIERIWTKHLATRRFVSLLRVRKIMDIDWLVDEVFRRIDPLDIRAVNDSSTDWRVPVTDKVKKNVRFVSKEDGVDVFELMRAAKAAPFIYGKSVILDGIEYIDGDLSRPLGTVTPLLQRSISKVISLETVVARSGKEMIESGRILVRICPSRKYLTRISVGKAPLARAFEAGYMDCASNSAIRRMLE